MTDPIELLEEALHACRQLDGADIPELTDRQRNKGHAHVGEINRELSYIRHLCERASVTVDTLYWANRGYLDPLNGAA